MKKRTLRILLYTIMLSCILCSCGERQNIPTSENTSFSAEKILENMPLSEKIYQMIFTTPEDITGVGCVTSAGDATKEALTKYPVGGLIYFSYNLKDREQVVSMLQNTKSYSKIPLFLGIDEEGGDVSRAGSNPDLKITKHPPMKDIGASGDTTLAYNTGKTLATELKDLGFNVDFAPVADVLVNKNNTEIGNRSFGDDPYLVASMVENTVRGLEENGLSSALKHFPGHASTEKNSHFGYSESKRSEDELRACEFIPFQAGIKAGCDFVMISHMTLLNTDSAPASMSYKVITEMLKEELGFSGIVITDSFKMGAVTDTRFSNNPEVSSILAGADMILMPKDITSAHDSIKNAVNSGKITEARIDESVLKIIKTKYESGLFKNE